MTSIERTAYPRFTRASSVKELRELYCKCDCWMVAKFDNYLTLLG